MNTILMMEEVNLFCGDHDPSASKHLTLTEIKLPALQEKFVEHHGGGARVAIEVNVGIEKLECTFKLNGFDPDLLVMFGLNTKMKNIFTAYGVVRDKRTGAATEAKAIIEARLGKAENSALSRGSITEGDYALNEITHYELWHDGNPKVVWDFFENRWEIDGVDENADVNRILRITSSS